MKKPKQEVLKALKDKIEKFIPIIKKSEKAKVNEADTRIIVTDILSNILGYDKYFELTAEQMIKSSYADFVIRFDDELKAVIEIKSIAFSLKNEHLRQAINYAANEGIPWAILTNGRVWKVYKVSVEGKIEAQQFFEFDLLNISEKDLENVYYLTRDALKSGLTEKYWQYKKALNPERIVKIILSEPLLKKLRQELAKETGFKITEEEVSEVLVTRIIRPNLIKSLIDQSSNKLSVETETDLQESLKGLSDIQLLVLKILSKSSEPVSSEHLHIEIKKHFPEFKSSGLGAIFRGLNKRLGKHIEKTEQGYLLSNEAKKAFLKLYTN